MNDDWFLLPEEAYFLQSEGQIQITPKIERMDQFLLLTKLPADVFIFYLDSKSEKGLLRRSKKRDEACDNLFIFLEYATKEDFKAQKGENEVGLFTKGTLDLKKLLDIGIQEVAVIKDGRVVRLRTKKLF